MYSSTSSSYYYNPNTYYPNPYSYPLYNYTDAINAAQLRGNHYSVPIALKPSEPRLTIPKKKRKSKETATATKSPLSDYEKKIFKIEENIPKSKINEPRSQSSKHQTVEYSFEDQIKKAAKPKPTPKDARYISDLGGYLMNENETKNWRGDRPISEYPINRDKNPNIIKLKQEKSVDKIKRFDYKYLQAPKLQPGKLVIKHEANHLAKEAPPVIIRIPATKRTPTPPSVIHRERPPTPPQIINETITIPGIAIIPPRRVITEQLPEQPSNPQREIYETWKPYQSREIEVVYEPEQDFLDLSKNPLNSDKNVVNFSFNVNKFNEFISPLTKDLVNQNGEYLNAVESVRRIDWKNVVHSEILKSLLKAYIF